MALTHSVDLFLFVEMHNALLLAIDFSPGLTYLYIMNHGIAFNSDATTVRYWLEPNKHCFTWKAGNNAKVCNKYVLLFVMIAL